MDLTPLKDATRLLLSVKLKPVQGARFQPTGFPDIGAATYKTADGREMLLVESAQSMANRLEAAALNADQTGWQTPLAGLPFVKVEDKSGAPITNSLLEAHRLNSPYILEGKDKSFADILKKELAVEKGGRADLQKLAAVLLKYDINSLLHGIFIAKSDIAGGRMRLPRALTAFIEAEQVKVAASGGVKNDVVNPSGDTAKGFGNVPFHRDEYTGDLTAFFNLDLAQIRGYGLGENIEKLLIALALYKVRALLDSPFRPRTACDLELAGGEAAITVSRPDGFVLPPLKEITDTLPTLIKAVATEKRFAEPIITVVKYEAQTSKTSKEQSESDASSQN